MKLKIDKPYPTVTVAGKNPYYAKRLLKDYADNTSENTAVHLYLYQHFILKQYDLEISKILETIAVVEMRHLGILGELITQLGVKPFFGTIDKDNIDYWSGDYVNYSTNINDILDINIEAESMAIKRYQDDLNIIDDIHIKKILLRIIEDEELHLKIFRELKDNLKKQVI